jgi:integrase
MSVYKDKSPGGKRQPWIADVSELLPGGRLVRKRKRAATKAAALELEKKLSAEILNPTPKVEKPPAPTVEDLLPRFLEYSAQEKKPSTVHLRRGVFRRDILPLLGRRRVDAIGTPEKEQLKEQLRARGITSPGSINVVLSALAALLRYAARLGFVEVVGPGCFLKVPEREVDCLSAEEFSALVDVAAASSPMELAAIRVGGDCGLRVGELLGLYWEDIELEATPPILKVRRTNWQGILGAPKSGKAREVALTPEAVEALKAWGPKARGFVFHSGRGRVLSYQAMTRRLAKLCRRAGLRRVTWHVARHTALTRLGNAQVAPHVLKEIAGHSSLRMTERYLHTRRADLWEAAQKISAKGRPGGPEGAPPAATPAPTPIPPNAPQGGAPAQSPAASGSETQSENHVLSRLTGHKFTDILNSSDTTPGNPSSASPCLVFSGDTPFSLSPSRRSPPMPPAAELGCYLGEGALYAFGDRLQLEELLQEGGEV